MDFPIAEILRIAGVVADNALPGIAGNASSAALNAFANKLDKEDDPETPGAVRKMRQKRRERWVDVARELEKEKLRHLAKLPATEDTTQIARFLGERAGKELRAIIKADLHDTEGGYAEDQEVNLYAEAASAAARRKL